MTDVVPAPLLRWAEGALGARVEAAAALPGGVDALTLRLDASDGSRVVLRALVDPASAADQPLSVDAAVLTALEGRGLPVPRLVAYDEDGAVAGVPALLMTWLPGASTGYLEDPLASARQLVEVLAVVHETHLPSLPPMTGERVLGEPFHGLAGEPLRDLVWGRLRSLLPPPDRELRPVHGDAWFGNTLWLEGGLTGLVDVSDARLSDPAADLAVVRTDVAMLAGPPAALGLPAAEHQLFWDLWVTALTLASTHEWHPAAAAIGWPLTASEQAERLRAHLAVLLEA